MSSSKLLKKPTRAHVFLALACCAGLSACSKDVATQKRLPAELTRDATGYFCGMIVEDHQGPKSQIALADSTEPLWFTTARDGIAFTRLPEETRPINAFYVTVVDQGEWDHPETDSSHWITAEAAWYVIESDKLSSMGTPEAIPFSTEQTALAFTTEFGGRVLRLADIPESYILGPGQKQISTQIDKPE
jgi:copper chaperone NosL